MRKRAKIDDNQREIVKALRKIDYSVISLASLGSGVPDLLIGIRGQNYLIELKDGKKSPSRRQLTIDERHFMDSWAGQVDVANSLEEILEIITK